jgi:Glutamate synthase domain 2
LVKQAKLTVILAGGVRDGDDRVKALVFGADAIAIGIGAMIAFNCNKDMPECNLKKVMGVPAGHCYQCHTGGCPVGVANQDPKIRKRLHPDDDALRVYNYLHTMTLEAQLLDRACGKTNIHSLEPEDLAALTMEASALAKVPLFGTNHTVGVDDFHKI